MPSAPSPPFAPSSARSALDARAIVVLGCRADLDASGRLRAGALAARVDAGARQYARQGGPGTLVVVSGGRRWSGGVEADVMARELALRGVPESAIVRERCSLSTRENARYVREALARRTGDGQPCHRVTLVTSDWHMRRAVVLFHRAGMVVEPAPAARQSAPWRTRVWRGARERLLAWLARVVLVALAFVAVAGCSRRVPPAGEGLEGPSASDLSLLAPRLAALAVAEDLRSVEDVPLGAQNAPEPAIRRRAARAFARILPADDAPLLRALEDDDPEVIAWAAYGLGESCKSSEDTGRAHVRALVARLASLEMPRAPSRVLDVHAALLRALGRCGGDPAEQTLRAWLRRAGQSSEAAAYALGDIASQRGTLSATSAAALLEAIQRSPPLDAALYPFARADLDGPPELRARALAVSRAALERAGPERIFAVRALGRSGIDAVADLARVLGSRAFTPAERAEAAHALAGMRDARLASPSDPGRPMASQVALGMALRSLVADDHGRAASQGDSFGVLLATVRALAEGPAAPRTAEADLRAIARLEPDGAATAAARRRLAALRCAAAERLARGAWDADVLRTCDVSDGSAGESARLASLDSGPLTGARRAAWAELARSKHNRVREAALEAIGRHPELGSTAIDALAAALQVPEPGVVATAADAVRTHPERAAPRVAEALRSALSRPWSEDLVETRVAVLDASMAVGLPEARDAARAACRASNATVRARAAKTLAAAGEPNARCPPPPREAGPAPAPEIGHELVHPTRVTFDTDAGALVVRFDPALAPVAATRFVSLARSGFYSGVAIHRVVAGFVVELGDPGGDGFGGSGRVLRCETSPVPFGALDVGVALAGRDTGSSQLFVTLSRQPHLDGEYAWVGRAEGDWDGVAEGDVVREARVEE